MINVKVNKGDSGFSLAELVLVLGIMAITAAFSVPIVAGSMRSWQLASDARNIANTLASAKLSAAAQMTHYRLSFNLGANSWRLEKYNRDAAGFDMQGSPKELSGGLRDSGIAFESASSTALPGFPTDSSTAITFNSRGIPIDASGMPTPANVIYLKSGPTQFAVSVSLAGKVQLWKNRSSQWVAQ